MIQSFEHKGLELFFTTGNKKGIVQNHAKKLSAILFLLDEAEGIKDAKLILGFHQLKGDLNERYSVKVTGGWRVHFKIIDDDIYVIDYENYH